MTKLCDINAAAKEKLPPGFTDKSGIGVHYTDAFIKPMNTKLPDGTRVGCKRKGLKLTLTVGAKKGEGLMRRLDVSKDPVVMLTPRSRKRRRRRAWNCKSRTRKSSGGSVIDILSGKLSFQILFDGLGNFRGGSGALLFVAPFPLRKKIVRAGQAFGLRQRINPDGKTLRQLDLDFIEVIPRLDL